MIRGLEWVTLNNGKMADVNCSEMVLVQVSKRILSKKKDIVCECCKNMKVELNEVD